MRKYMFFLLCLAGLSGMAQVKMNVAKKDGTVIVVDVEEIDSVRLVAKIEIEEELGEYVDLGLPSGILWATCNVGAKKPDEYGDLFAWGETTTKSVYTTDTYQWYDTKTHHYTKYVWNEFDESVKAENTLYPEDDAAQANLGKEWRTPSMTEFIELLDKKNTTMEWCTNGNGINGYKITSKKNKKSIFLPAAGTCYESGLVASGEFGTYMCRDTPTTDEAVCFMFRPNQPGIEHTNRYSGKSVRAICYPE